MAYCQRVLEHGLTVDDLRLQVVGWWRAFFALWLGEVYFCQGQVSQARALFKAVLITSQEAGYRHLAGVAERCLGASLYRPS